MALSKRLERFLDDNAELINSQNLKELYIKMGRELGYTDNIDLASLLTLLLAPEEFKITIEETDPGRPVLEGVVYNLTPTKAKGAPLTPALFRAKAHLVLYEISGGKVVSSLKYVLSTREEFNEMMAPQGKYNLAIMDSPKFVKLVQEAFGGNRAYDVIFTFNLKAFDRDGVVNLFKRKIPVAAGEDPKTAIIKSFRETSADMNSNIREKGVELIEEKNIK